MLRGLRNICLLLLLLGGGNTYAQIFKPKDKAEDLYNEALREQQKKNYARAAELGKQAFSHRSNDADIAFLTARMYLLSGNGLEGRKYIKATLEAAPKYREAYFTAINLEMQAKQYYEALCFAEDGLNQFPTDRELIVKKLTILQLMDRMSAAGNYIGEMVEKLPYDTALKRYYIDHYLYAGNYYKKKDIPSLAAESYRKVLTTYPGNEEAREALLALNISTGGYYYALDQLNAELQKNQRSYDLLMKKLGILQEMHNYAEAIHTVNTILKYYPNDAKARKLNTELRMEAGGYYANTDPYMLYESVIEKNPGNREALNKLIGLSMSRGAYREALNWINRGLRSSPNDRKLLSQKLDVLEFDRKFTEAALLAEKIYRQQPTASNRDRMTDLKIASGREFLVQEQYDLAMNEFEAVLKVDPGNIQALNNIINRYTLQRKYPAAIATIDKAMARYPDNEDFILKKAGILAEAGRYEEAAIITMYLHEKHPGNAVYTANLAEFRLAAGRALQQNEEYDLARIQFMEALAADSANLEALNYLINLEAAAGQYDNALKYVAQAFRNDKKGGASRDMMMKQASILQQKGDYAEAARITRLLMNGYPYTKKFKDAHIESLMAAGVDFSRKNQPDSAIQRFDAILKLDPKDSLALHYATNIMAGKKAYDSALVYIDQSLKYYPDNEQILRKKVEMLESKSMYAEAALYADTLLRKYPGSANRDYAHFLKSKTLRNQFGLFFLNSTYDYTDSKYNIATVEYRRFFNRGSFAGRINYAGRQQGTGVQGEAEMYYTHSKRFYSYAFAAVANKIAFPKLRAGYSLFATLPKETEAELGIRYLNADSSTSISGVTSLAKQFGDFWVNGRAYFISEESDFYTSLNLTTRYYMNNRQDYLALIAGLGTSPDDRSRLINFPKLSGLLTRSVGAGYQRTFQYRNTLGIYGTWINQKITDTDFQNQYDIYITFQRKF